MTDNKIATNLLNSIQQLIDFNLDEELVLSCVQKTITSIREKQHEATKEAVHDLYISSAAGLDEEELNSLEVPRLNI